MANNFIPGFDKRKLKVKHLLGIYHELPGYPDVSDILYWLVESQSFSKKKDGFFTDQQLSDRFSLTRERANEIIQTFIDSGYVQKEKETNLKTIFKLIKNPFI